LEKKANEDREAAKQESKGRQNAIDIKFNKFNFRGGEL